MGGGPSELKAPLDVDQMLLLGAAVWHKGKPDLPQNPGLVLILELLVLLFCLTAFFKRSNNARKQRI